MPWSESFKHLFTYASALMIASILNLILRAIIQLNDNVDEVFDESFVSVFGGKTDEERAGFQSYYRQMIHRFKALMFFGALAVGILLSSLGISKIPQLAEASIWISIACIVMSQVIPWVFCTAPQDNGRPHFRWRKNKK
jgi:hypothetical protein